MTELGSKVQGLGVQGLGVQGLNPHLTQPDPEP